MNKKELLKTVGIGLLVYIFIFPILDGDFDIFSSLISFITQPFITVLNGLINIVTSLPSILIDLVINGFIFYLTIAILGDILIDVIKGIIKIFSKFQRELS